MNALEDQPTRYQQKAREDAEVLRTLRHWLRDQPGWATHVPIAEVWSRLVPRDH